MTYTPTMQHEVELSEMQKRIARTLGRLACIRIQHAGDTRMVYGNVIDCYAGTDSPNRIRIQRGLPERHGDVVQPHEYSFMWFADTEED